MNRQAPDPSVSASSAAASTEAPPAPLQSQSLFRGACELLIDHDGAIYRLRVTGKGKLILTK